MRKRRRPNRPTAKTAKAAVCSKCGCAVANYATSIRFRGPRAPQPLELCATHSLELMAVWMLLDNYRLKPVDDPNLNALLDRWEALDEAGRAALARSWKVAAESN